MNVCGLRKKCDNGILNEYVKQYDIICLSETRTDTIDSSCFPNFQCIFANKKNPTHSLGGIHGLAILVSTKLNAEFQVLNVTSSDSVLWIKLDTPKFSVLIGSVYVPHEGSKYFDDEWNERIIDDCIALKVKFNLPFVLVGDFNARTGVLDDFVTYDDTIQAATDLDLLNDDINVKNDLEDLGFCTTRYNMDHLVNNNGRKLISLCQNVDVHIINGRVGADKGKGQLTCASASTVDYILASSDLLFFMHDFSVDVFDKLMSDKHCPISASLRIKGQPDFIESDCERSDVSIPPRIRWDHSKRDTFSSALDNDALVVLQNYLDTLLGKQMSQNNIDEAAGLLRQVYINAAMKSDIFIHSKFIRGNRKQNKQNVPWFDSSCKAARKEYHKCKDKFRSSRCEKNKEELNVKGKSYRCFLRGKKRSYYKALHDRLRYSKSKCPKDYWKILNVKSKAKEPSAKISLDSFVEHFKGFGSEHFSASEHGFVYDDGNNQVVNEELNREIQEDEVMKQIRRLKNNKAPGIDLILNELLKSSSAILVESIVRLFNFILDSGFVPSDWSIGMIKPLFKGKGSPESPDNYRGITLLSCVGKLFTAILNDRIVSFLEANNLLGEEQAGFRAGYSCMDHAFSLYSILDWYLSYKKKRVYCAFIDYKKSL